MFLYLTVIEATEDDFPLYMGYVSLLLGSVVCPVPDEASILMIAVVLSEQSVPMSGGRGRHLVALFELLDPPSLSRLEPSLVGSLHCRFERVWRGRTPLARRRVCSLGRRRQQTVPRHGVDFSRPRANFDEARSGPGREPRFVGHGDRGCTARRSTRQTVSTPETCLASKLVESFSTWLGGGPLLTDPLCAQCSIFESIATALLVGSVSVIAGMYFTSVRRLIQRAKEAYRESGRGGELLDEVYRTWIVSSLFIFSHSRGILDL